MLNIQVPLASWANSRVSIERRNPPEDHSDIGAQVCGWVGVGRAGSTGTVGITDPDPQMDHGATLASGR